MIINDSNANEIFIDFQNKTNFNNKMNKNPNQLNIFLIKNILTYLEPIKVINSCLFLNKAINKLFHFKIFEKEIKTEYLLRGKENMNEIYVEYDIDNILEKTKITNEMISNIEFELESKDQGWAWFNDSNSWIELKIIEKTNDKLKEKILGVYELVRNFKETDYKKTKISLINFSPNGKLIINLIRMNKCKIQIVARSKYPGWLCYIRLVKTKFSFFDIDLA